MPQIPEPIRVLLLGKALSAAQVEVLLQLERLYPEGLLDPSWASEPGVQDPTVQALMAAWREKRPESHPPAPIWKCSREVVIACPQLPTLLESYQTLLTYATAPGQGLPQWLTASWWWGCAAVMCRTSAPALQQAIAGWAKRYQCAVLYLQSHDIQRDPAILAAYQADLRYSHSERIYQEMDFTWAIRDGFPWGEWYLPSEMQPWGRQAQQGRRIVHLPPRRSEPQQV